MTPVSTIVGPMLSSANYNYSTVSSSCVYDRAICAVNLVTKHAMIKDKKNDSIVAIR
jgi:hypothetical protein